MVAFAEYQAADAASEAGLRNVGEQDVPKI
jgi:hypothetical protein